MPMELQDAQDALLTALTTDVNSAWLPSSIYRDAPETEVPVGSILPLAYLYFEEIAPDETFQPARCTVGVRHRVVAALRFKRETGTLLSQKQARAEALRVLIINGRKYNGLERRWVGEEYLPTDPDFVARESKAAWSFLTMRFDFWIEADAE